MLPIQLNGSPQSYIPNASGCQQDSVFEYNNAQYAFLVSGGYAAGLEGDGKYHALKSIDNGVTWIEKDSAHAPNPPGEGVLAIPGWRPSQSICKDGSTIYLLTATYSVGNTSGVKTWTFNLNTDTWTVGITSTNVKPQYGTGGAEYTPVLKLIRISAGNFVCIFGAAQNGTWSGTNQRIFTSTFDGTTFGAAAILPGQTGAGFNYLLGDAFVDSSGYLTVYYHIDNPIPQANLYSITRSNLAVWGTEKTVDDTTNFNLISGNASNQAYGGVGQFGSKICLLIAYSGATDSCNFYWANAGTLNPVWNKAVVADNLTDILAFFAKPGKAYALAVGSDGNLYAFWTINDNGQNVDFNGRWQYAVASQSDPTTWGLVNDLFTTTPIPTTDWGSYGTLVWLMGTGIGILGISVNGNRESDDYDGVATDFDTVAFPTIAVNDCCCCCQNISYTSTKYNVFMCHM